MEGTALAVAEQRCKRRESQAGAASGAALRAVLWGHRTHDHRGGEDGGVTWVPQRLEMRLPSTSLCRFLPPQTAPPLLVRLPVVGGKAPGGRALGVIAGKARATGAGREAAGGRPRTPWVSVAVYRLTGQPLLVWKPLWKITTGGCAEPAPRTEPGARPLALSPRPCVARGHGGCWPGLLHGKWGHGHPRPQWGVRGCHLGRFCVIHMFTSSVYPVM